MAVSNRFVGREAELRHLEEMLDDPRGKERILFIHGPGGIGKTLLIQEMLARASSKVSSWQVAPELIDVFSTNYRHIDGIQTRIIELLEPSIGSQPFAEYRNRPTPEKFRACLASVCQEHRVVLAFDTFENIESDVAGRWVLDDERGLQLPGLFCIVGGRHAPPDTEIIRPLHLTGFALGETIDLYKKRANEPVDEDLRQFLEELVEKTKGHPLLLQIVFEWLQANLWSREAIKELPNEEFEQKLLFHMRELGERGELYYGDALLSLPVYQTIVCMAYLNRRFDQDFLQRIVAYGYVKLDGTSPQEILRSLEGFFFVKVRDVGEIQLHDEMARLILAHLWPGWGNLDGSTRREFAGQVVKWYDEQIDKAEAGDQDVLQAEKLFYALRYDLDTGKQLLFELSERHSEQLDKLLPGEMKDYIGQYGPEDQYQINKRLAQMEAHSQHHQQAIAYWRMNYELGEKCQHDDWRVEALVGQHNSTWQSSPSESLEECLRPAMRLCEQRVPDQLSTVQYEIGFTYRQMQDIDKAIEWYTKARDSAKYATTKPLLATILNDLGYAYTLIGEYQKSEIDVKEALNIRMQYLADIQRDLDEIQMRVKATTQPADKAKLREHQTLLRIQRSEAAMLVGMTFNTVGEVSRYRGRWAMSVYHYSQALKIFEAENNFRWQAKALFSRAESHRRHALYLFDCGDLQGGQDHTRSAMEDVEKSIYFCEKYGVDDERDTAHRRKGRLLHDAALRLIGRDNQQVQNLLNEALQQFEEGLRFARRTNDVLEQFENLREIAFIADDLARIPSATDAARSEHQQYIDQLAQAIEIHSAVSPRIYQFPVFENELKIEQGAYLCALGRYEEALPFYLSGYTGLASDPGYGTARYQVLFNHLTSRIQELKDPELVKHWCQKFLMAWETTLMQRREPPRTLAQSQPDLVEWCKIHLLQVGSLQ